MSYPTTIAGFYTYLFRAYPWMHDNLTRLGILPAKFAELEAIVGDESTVGTFFYNQKKYDLAPKRKDSILCANLKSSTTDVKKKISEILDDTAASKWTNDDRSVFKRKKGLPRKQKKPEKQIPFECVVDIVPSSNGVFDFNAKPRDETKRYHLAEGSNSIEMSYAIVQSAIRKAGDNPDKVRETCIGVDDHTVIKTFYKAKFQHTIESALIGYNLYCWFRFTNTHYPEFAGKWSDVQIKLIV